MTEFVNTRHLMLTHRIPPWALSSKARTGYPVVLWKLFHPIPQFLQGRSMTRAGLGTLVWIDAMYLFDQLVIGL